MDGDRSRVISIDSRPRLAAKTRLRFDRKAGQYMLLYPEKGLALNPTAAAIAKLCTGEHTVGAIVDQLLADYRAGSREAVERDVFTFLDSLTDRGLLADER
ncbi:MAG TPA: pyrroloquinoline quinone biosynthesis peptide chaperone PqqD [Methylomirabilota bacterium]|nr:pyrroloquinoline quinone biosynthesis peptide chaperone PqqD [Methylomirabilota bacterium]